MDDTAPLDAAQLAAYFALMEVSSLLQHAVDRQLRIDGGVSYVQFQLLARLSAAPGGWLRMTDLADSVVYSRSGLTYQAAQLEKAGLITRDPSTEDERSIIVRLTDTGRSRLQRVMPGHIEVVRRMLLSSLSQRDMEVLTRILERVRDHMRSTPPRSATPRSRRRSGDTHETTSA